MSRISLSAAMSSNLRALKSLSGQMNKTQEHLSSGLKVNSAIDNASSYYQARSLSSRAADLEALLDSLGQGIQAIEAANAGLEHATGILEQMSAITEQTIVGAQMAPMTARIEFKDNSAELVAAGYRGVSTVAELKEALQQDEAKIVLLNDISSAEQININFSNKNVVINGGGHSLEVRSIYNYQSNTKIENIKLNTTNNDWWSRGIYSSQKISLQDMELSYTNTRTDNVGWLAGLDMRGGGTVENVSIKVNGGNNPTISAIECWGTTELTNVSMDITGGSNSIIAGIGSHNKNLTVKDIGMTAHGSTDVYGIIGPVTGITSNPAGRPSQGRPDALYNGKANTQAIVAELGSCGSAAKAATEFYAKADGSDQGNWYLPAIGELMELYGTDNGAVNSMWSDTSGAVGDNKKEVNNTLKALKQAGVEAEELINGWYWSSSECNGYSSWRLNLDNGGRNLNNKNGNDYVRTFQLLENCFSSLVLSDAHPEGVGGALAPQVGDVLYDDNTYSAVEDYEVAAEGGRRAVGVVAWVSEDGQTLKAVNLKNLSFSSPTAENNFDPANPYNNTSTTTRWSTGSKMYQNVKGIEDYGEYKALFAINPNAPVTTVDELNQPFLRPVADEYQARYNEALTEYDNLINDSSYQGVNLLKGGKLELTFNETRSNKFAVAGKDISTQGLGLTLADWFKTDGILQSMEQLQKAVSELRAFAGELGNSYGIIQTRQDFTGALTEVLETGADNLLLADMNEESANYLALQTRQQLAVNSLSLAAESAQSILSLF